MVNPKKTHFDEVKGLNLSAKELMARYGRQAVEARRSTYADPVAKARVGELADLIERDMNDMNDQVSKIEKTHSSWPDRPKRASHITKALLVGGQYIEIIDNINNTIGVSAFELVELMNNENIAATQATSPQPMSQQPQSMS